MSTMQHKRGDAFEPECTEMAAGVPVNLTGYTVTSQIRTRAGDELVDTATVTLADQTTDPGKFTVEVAKARTALWVPGQDLEWDVEFTPPNGKSWSSGTVTITVVKDITR
jgi:hypothetical protein